MGLVERLGVELVASFSGVQTLLALAIVYAKSGRRERCSQKNA